MSAAGARGSRKVGAAVGAAGVSAVAAPIPGVAPIPGPVAAPGVVNVPRVAPGNGGNCAWEANGRPAASKEKARGRRCSNRLGVRSMAGM